MKPVFGQGAGAHIRAPVRNWLDLSLNRGLPSSLLLLSQAFAITTSSAAQKGAEPGAAAPSLLSLGGLLDGVDPLVQAIVAVFIAGNAVAFCVWLYSLSVELRNDRRRNSENSIWLEASVTPCSPSARCIWVISLTE
jgi:hypothetical protein